MLTIEYIISKTCEELHISESDLKSKSRKKEIVHSKQIVSVLSKLNTPSTLKSIAIELGGMHHSSIINHLKNFETDYLYNYKGFRDNFDKVKSVCLIERVEQ
jgi:chromosomal replication initiation ATPase DnaA